MLEIYEIYFKDKAMDDNDNDNNIIKLTVHYEELYESENEIELAALATSWQGLARLLESITQLCCYGKLQTEDTSTVKVTTKARLTKGSILNDIYVKAVELGLFEGSGTAIIATVLGYLLGKKYKKNDSDAFEALKKEIEELKLKISGSTPELAKTDAIKQAELIKSKEPLLRKKCRSFLDPIGSQCKKISMKYKEKTLFVADEDTKRFFAKQNTILNNQELLIELRKIDKKTGAGTVILTDEQGNEQIVNAKISDLLFEEENNEYLDSFANRRENKQLKVLAQKVIDEEGKIVKINIQSLITEDAQ